MRSANETEVRYEGGSPIALDPATKELRFNGVPIVWVPDFDTNFGYAAPAIPWTKRCYMLDMRHMKLERDSSQFRKMQYMGRPVNQLAYHFAKTSTYGLKTSKRNAHAALAIA
jgi:hypothetical protein